MAGIDHLIRTDFKAVDKHDELRTVMGWLTGDMPRPPIVMDDGRAVGVINERSLMRRRLDPRTKLDNHTKNTRALAPESALDDAVQRMLEFRAAYLPVEGERGEPAGYIRALDILREIDAKLDAATSSAKVTSLAETATLGDALNVFGKEYVDVLPVVNPHGQVVGIIRRKYVLQLEATQRAKGRLDNTGESIDPLKMLVSGVMDTGVVTLPHSATSSKVLDTLDSHGYAIVLDSGSRYHGIVTPNTVLERATHAAGGALPAPPTAKRAVKGMWHRHA